MAGGGKAIEALGEVLHHVVALRLTVDQHVQPDRLLGPDDALNLYLAESPIVLIRHEARCVLLTRSTDLSGLGEGSDGRGREGRQGCCLSLGLPSPIR